MQVSFRQALDTSLDVWLSLVLYLIVKQEDYTTDEEMLTVQGVKGGAGGILDLLKASKQVAGLDSVLRYFILTLYILHAGHY